MSERGSETLGTRLDKAGGFDQADARRVILAEVLSGRVRGRNSDSRRIRKALGWAPSKSLRRGLERTYAWIEMQVSGKRQ
jgi:nucleoside-diphosphate-sugar epimerase